MAENLITVPDKATNDEYTASEYNQINDAIKDGTKSIKTLALTIPSSGTLTIYASDGTTEVLTIDDNGNLSIKGRVISL